MALGTQKQQNDDQDLDVASSLFGPKNPQAPPLGLGAGGANPALMSPFDASLGAGAGGANPAHPADANGGGGLGLGAGGANPSSNSDQADASGSMGVGNVGGHLLSSTDRGAGSDWPGGGGMTDPWSATLGSGTSGGSLQPHTQPTDRMGAGTDTADAGSGGHLGDSTGSTDKASSGSAGSDKAGSSGDITAKFSDMATQLAQATDPAQKAVLHDQLARNIYGTLSDAGHDVKWQDDQTLLVDGRPYVVGAGAQPPLGSGSGGASPLGPAGGGPPLGLGAGGANPALLPPSDDSELTPIARLALAGGNVGTGQGGNDRSGGTSGLSGDAGIGLDASGALRGGAGVSVDNGSGGEIGGMENQPQQGSSGWGSAPDDLGGDQGPLKLAGSAGAPGATGAGPDISNTQGFLVGFDPGKLNDPSSGSADGSKYTPAAKLFAKLAVTMPIQRGNLQGVVDAAKANGFPNAKVAGDDKIDFGDGAGAIDVVRSDGQPVFQNTTGNAQWESGHGGTSGGSSGGGTSDLGSMYDQVFGDTKHASDGLVGVGGGGSSAGSGGSSQSGFSLSGPGYTPGSFDNSDLQGLSSDDILNRLGPTYSPGTLATDYQAGQVDATAPDAYQFNGLGDLGQLGAGKTDAQTEDLVSRILANPESLDPHTVDMLKAKSKDELADMAKSDDQNMVQQGYANGIQDSNWLASERMQRSGDRDRALVESNRNIDMQAAQTNAQDRKDAAQLGAGYAQAKSAMNRADAAETLAEKQAAEGDSQAAAQSRAQAASFRLQAQQANESLRADAADRNLKASQANIDNQFKSQDEKQAAIKLAADTQLAAAAQKGDRTALEEGFKQKAAELGQSADKLKEDYILANMDDLTKRYGIDTSAGISRAQLSEQSTEFKQDLIFKLMQLKQQNDQFGAQYGLDFLQTQNAMNNSAWQQTFGS